MTPSTRTLTGLLAAAFASAVPAPAQDPSVDGQWDQAFPLPLPGIHAVLMPPDGRVMLYSYEIAGGGGSYVWSLDPVTLNLVQFPQTTNIFCGGHALLENGDVLVVGGTGGHFNTGNDKTWTFNDSNGFTQVSSMATGRWYPTVVPLADGRFLTMAGLNQGGVDTPLVEIYDPQLDAWSVLPGADKLLPLYPMAFFLPSRKVVVAGPHKDTELLDPITGQWTYVDRTSKSHHEGCAVLLPPYPDRVMVMGGHNLKSTTTFKRVEILDMSAATPIWRKTSPMRRRRQHHNAIVLPDGQVLVIGGRRIVPKVRHLAFNPPWDREVATKHAEVFDPLTETWTLLAPQERPRLYHSTGILLKDGRVLTAGGEGEPSGEIFSPPYLFQGPRPTLTGVPGTASYSATFTVQSDQADQIASACLIAPGAVTHSLDMHQRYLAVDVEDLGGGNLRITTPISSSEAQPGYYLLFVVNGAGVPSIGEFVRLQ